MGAGVRNGNLNPRTDPAINFEHSGQVGLGTKSIRAFVDTGLLIAAFRGEAGIRERALQILS
jgi:hypothetical protein